MKQHACRVFITDEHQNLLPPCLRFPARGRRQQILPLNISRYCVEPSSRAHTPTDEQAGAQRTAEEAAGTPRNFEEIQDNFGTVLKEDLYEIARPARPCSSPLLDDCRSWVSLDQYIEAMKPGQEAIYTITGDNLDLVADPSKSSAPRHRGAVRPADRRSGFRRSAQQGKPFKSATRGDLDLGKIQAADKDAAEKPRLRRACPASSRSSAWLGDAVKDVRSSARLTDSARCTSSPTRATWISISNGC